MTNYQKLTEAELEKVYGGRACPTVCCRDPQAGETGTVELNPDPANWNDPQAIA